MFATRSTHNLKACLLVTFNLLAATAHAATKVAVIDGGTWLFPESHGQRWCSFLNANGFECTLFPESGPTSSLDAFAVVIDMSHEWTDSEHALVAVINSARGVITWGNAPQVLGIDTDSTVRVWIGANLSSEGTQSIRTTDFDSILGDLPPGTEIEHSGKFGARGIEDIAGHANAKILARHNSGNGAIALLRNRTVGQSVYLSEAFTIGPTLDEQIILRAVQELSVKVIPATTAWGCIVLVIGICAASVVLIRRKSPRCHRKIPLQYPSRASAHK